MSREKNDITTTYGERRVRSRRRRRRRVFSVASRRVAPNIIRRSSRERFIARSRRLFSRSLDSERRRNDASSPIETRAARSGDSLTLSRRSDVRTTKGPETRPGYGLVTNERTGRRADETTSERPVVGEVGRWLVKIK